MLPSVQKAHFVHGNRQKAMASECNVTDSTWYKWVTGRLPCPKAKRQSVDRAFGEAVDWEAYDREVMATKTPKAPEIAPEPPQDAVSAPVTPKPAKPAPEPRSAAQDEFDALYGIST